MGMMKYLHKLRSNFGYTKKGEIARFVPGYKSLLGRRVKYNDILGFDHSVKEIFEEEIYKITIDKDEPLIIDCGSNIGLSLIYFKKAYPNSKIISFEADADIYKILLENIDEFELQNIRTYNLAVWNEEKVLAFYKEGSLAGSVAEEFKTRTSAQVQAIPLRNFLKDQVVDFLKIDIEGAEHVVLIDCEEYLGNVKAMFIEYHSFHDQPQKLSEILDILERNGFRYYIKSANDWNLHPLAMDLDDNQRPDFFLQLNILASKL